jgi:hypothetical protein
MLCSLRVVILPQKSANANARVQAAENFTGQAPGNSLNVRLRRKEHYETAE